MFDSGIIKTIDSHYVGSVEEYFLLQRLPHILFFCILCRKELYILFLKKDGKYRLVNVNEYAQKHGFQPNYIWTLCNTLYTELKGVLDGK